MERNDRGEAMLTLGHLPLEKSSIIRKEKMNHCCKSKAHFSDTREEKQHQKSPIILQSMGFVTQFYSHSFFA